ncbi:quinon protein alcohol dehydrogenase-like superfamily [Gorgonomyces haynaldii]|nr:quinon protein alcohol dehydrogenase-like superfamily [Gorgonomyces haynaldii]
MRKRKTIVISDVEAKECISLCFSQDCKLLVTQTSQPDWMLHFWGWEKSKLLTSIKTCNPSERTNQQREFGMGNTIYQVSISPLDSTQLCVTGWGIFKLLRYQEGQLKQMPTVKYETKNILSHCWTSDDKLILGTEDGKIIVLESTGEVKWETTFVYKEQRPMPIQSILSYSKGFIVGGIEGCLSLFERVDEIAGQTNPVRLLTDQQQQGTKEMYRRQRDYQTADETARILNIAISPNEDQILFSTDNCQIYGSQLTHVDVKSEDAKLEPFTQPSHHGPITGMDTCIRKPLVVTCSSDRSVRVWNYLEANSELVKYFSDEAYSVAIHPSGLYILVGFSDKLRLMNLLIDDIRPFREFSVRGCRECRFSNGGQYFAAVHANTVQIYSTWTFENLGNLKGHNAKVRSVHWTHDDSRIITAGVDGAVYDWSLKDLSGYGGIGIKRENESIVKSCAYTCASTSSDSKSIYCVGNDKTLKEIVEGGQIARELPFDVTLTQIVLSHSGRMMFVGTAQGTIRALKYPFGVDSGQFQEHQAHAAPVTRLRVSYDDQFLFSCSEDGCMFIFRIAEREGRGAKRERDLVYADEILVTKSDLEEKNSIMSELKTRVEELKMENEYQLRLKDMNFNEKIKEVTEKFMQEIEALKITATVLRTDKGKEEMRHDEEMAEEKERHAKEYLELETMQNAKLMSEYEKYQELQTKTAEMQAQWESQMKDMQVAKDQALEDLTRHFEIRLKEKQAEIDQVPALKIGPGRDQTPDLGV